MDGALRRGDRLALDEIFSLVQQHRVAVATAASLFPLAAVLVLFLLEERKRVTHFCEGLRAEIEGLRREILLLSLDGPSVASAS